MIENYIKFNLMKTSKKIDGLYLYIEKNPQHGNADFLIKYYDKYGFNKMSYDDNEYFYMYKKIKNSPSKQSTVDSLTKSINSPSKQSSNVSLTNNKNNPSKQSINGKLKQNNPKNKTYRKLSRKLSSKNTSENK